jgi:hypothetical protein
VLSELEETFADAWGLALVATTVTALVAERTFDAGLLVTLSRLGGDAHELQADCLDLAAAHPAEIADELRARAQARRGKASDLAAPWFKAGTGAVEAWVFLAMAEAGEVAIWKAVRRLAGHKRHRPFERLAASAVKVQQGHLDAALEGIEAVAASPGAGLSASVAAGEIR